MRNKKRNVCVGLAALLLLSAAQGAGAQEKMADTGFVMPTGDMAVLKPSKPMELLSGADAQQLDEQMAGYTPTDSGLLVNRASTYYYYNTIDPVAKEIYDVMYGVAKDPVSEGNIGLIMTDLDPQSEEYYYEFNLAYRAICFDHPELFWLYSGEEAEMCYYSEAINQNGFYFVYIMMNEPFTGFEAQMTAFNQAADAFLADIDTSGSEYDTVRQVHDKLIALVNYNDPVVEELRVLQKGQDLAHTAYGALVTDTKGNPNYAVCDGYTLAFEYLLQQCGIEVVFVAGMAGADEASAGGHAWNTVKIDDVWYEVDSTWNDTGSMEDDLTPGTQDYNYLMEALSDAAYREKMDHYLFLVSTERISNFDPGEDYCYTTMDQQYVYQLAQPSVHMRLEDNGEEMDFDAQIISTAPVALMNYS